jgi:hypothetical protein
VDALEQDAFEVLRLVRLIKNSLAPITRVPPDVLSLIPDYAHEEDLDKDLIALTHVCRRWRDIFISRSSLWTRFYLKDIDKTCAYIQRSHSSPINLYLGNGGVLDDTFPLIVPHIHRLNSLTVDSYSLPSIFDHLRCHTPLLEMLDVRVSPTTELHLNNALFNQDLPLLRELHLDGFNTHFPWKKFANLRVVELNFSSQIYGTTQILDFLESAPLLHTVSLHYSMPDSSDAPPERTVPLRHLNAFSIIANPLPTILLHHLHIPTGASLTSEFNSSGEESPFSDYLTPNFSNLSDITTTNLFFNSNRTFVRFGGPSGSLYALAFWRETVTLEVECRIFRSLDPILSTTKRLTVFRFGNFGSAELRDWQIFETLSSMNNLRTLILTDCSHLPFIRALDPEQNPSNLVLCVNMEGLILYLSYWDDPHFENVFCMAKNRASKGTKLSSVTFIDLMDGGLTEDMVKLREHVTCMEYRVADAVPSWDDVPGGNGGERE